MKGLTGSALPRWNESRQDQPWVVERCSHKTRQRHVLPSFPGIGRFAGSYSLPSSVHASRRQVTRHTA